MAALALYMRYAAFGRGLSNLKTEFDRLTCGKKRGFYDYLISSEGTHDIWLSSPQNHIALVRFTIFFNGPPSTLLALFFAQITTSV